LTNVCGAGTTRARGRDDAAREETRRADGFVTLS